MLEKLEQMTIKYKQLEELLQQPAVIENRDRFVVLQKEYASLEPIMTAYQSHRSNEAAMEEMRPLLASDQDPEWKELVKEELKSLMTEQDRLEKKIKELLLPKDPNDDKNAILEIRAGSGGEEAALWASDLFRMYQKLAEKKGWNFQVIDYAESSSKGYKEVIINLSGKGVYATLKYESGIHRVQRVPSTEAQGRIHTSAASVVVLPEMSEVEVALDMKDVRKDTFCSSGPGGQSVNTTYSAIRLTHIPTGIVVSCQDEKSQLKNFDKALKVLRARLYDIAYKEQQEKIGASRKSMIGSGDRSEKIRTYNYPQARVTDHRINYSQHNLAQVMEGEVASFIEKLQVENRSQQLAAEKVLLPDQVDMDGVVSR